MNRCDSILDISFVALNLNVSLSVLLITKDSTSSIVIVVENSENSNFFTHIIVFGNGDLDVVITLKLVNSRALHANYATDVAAVDFDRHSDLHDHRKKCFRLKSFS